MNDAQRRSINQLRLELRGWGLRLDRMMRMPSGTWLANNVGSRQVDDLDLDEIEVFCVVAYNQWKQVISAHYADERSRLGRNEKSD